MFPFLSAMYVIARIAPMKSATRSRDVLMNPPTPVSGRMVVAMNSTISFSAPTPKPAIIVSIEMGIQFFIGNFMRGFSRTNIMSVAMPNPRMWTNWSYLRMWYGAPTIGIRIFA